MHLTTFALCKPSARLLWTCCAKIQPVHRFPTLQCGEIWQEVEIRCVLAAGATVSLAFAKYKDEVSSLNMLLINYLVQ